MECIETSLVGNNTLLVTILAESIFGNYSQGGNAMFIALTENENQPGQYTLDYKVSKGQLMSGAIIDDEGETLAKYGSARDFKP